MGDDEGIGCETMWCDADDGSIQCKDVDGKGPGCDEKVLPNFLAREEEEPLERQFDLHFDLLFDTRGRRKSCGGQEVEGEIDDRDCNPSQ